MIFIGQRLHEDDLAAYLENRNDGFDWEVVKLQAIDVAGNVLAPNIISKERLLNEQDKNPYVYSSQYQQEPTPAGGGIFKKEDFITLDIEPPLLGTFITADTAETDKEYNDATVFSFWGIYQPVVHGRIIPELYALHWLDCWELRVEPKDLENSFFDFWAQCMMHKKKPILAAIEKKSTGTTLVSRLKGQTGIKVYEIERSRASGSKITRFLNAQPYISQKLVTLPRNAKHTEMCITHMTKITANNTHRHDDICDTTVDAIRLGLEDRIVLNQVQNMAQSSIRSRDVMETYTNISELRHKAYNEYF
jgi:predicted phage terminase large subunit-like protein